MKIIAALVLLSLVAAIKAQCMLWTNQTIDRSVASLSDESATPLGYLRIEVPPPEAMLAAPCRTIDVPVSGQYFQVAFESVIPGGNSRLCIRVRGNTDGTCGNGQGDYCEQAPNSGNVTVEFYCDGSCDQSYNTFYYRVTLSPEEDRDNENWCQDLATEYPSSLLIGTPSGSVSQPTTPSGDIYLAQPFSLLIALVVIASSYIFM